MPVIDFIWPLFGSTLLAFAFIMPLAPLAGVAVVAGIAYSGWRNT